MRFGSENSGPGDPRGSPDLRHGLLHKESVIRVKVRYKNPARPPTEESPLSKIEHQVFAEKNPRVKGVTPIAWLDVATRPEHPDFESGLARSRGSRTHLRPFGKGLDDLPAEVRKIVGAPGRHDISVAYRRHIDILGTRIRDVVSHSDRTRHSFPGEDTR